MAGADSLPQPPAHLSPSATHWWRTIVETYVLQEHHLRLLEAACDAWDRMVQAREQLAREGLTVPGREGGLRPHPCIAIEHSAQLRFARMLRELDLDVEPPPSERYGPPGILSNRGRHAHKVSRS